MRARFTCCACACVCCACVRGVLDVFDLHAISALDGNAILVGCVCMNGCGFLCGSALRSGSLCWLLFLVWGVMSDIPMFAVDIMPTLSGRAAAPVSGRIINVHCAQRAVFSVLLSWT